MADELIIDARTTDKISNLLTGRKHSITVKRNFQFNVIEMEDVNFHFDSAVLLPDYGPDAPRPGTEEQNRVTGLAVIFACYKHSEKNAFAQKILITGHTDKKGSEFYNLTLSQQRAENVFFMLTGNRIKWVDSSISKNQVEDVQQILNWIDFNFQYDCDPGEKTNKMNQETSTALQKFQKRYNQDFVDLKKHENKFSRPFVRIEENGKPDKQTWGAFFDMYVLELLIVMGIKEDGLSEIQTKLSFIKKGPSTPPPVVGCGEHFPKSESTTEQENPVDRRVEILFFDEGEEPELKCHPAKLICKHKVCDLFNTEKIFKPVPVKVDPLPLPSGIAVRVHLKFIYKTPEGDERAFPKNFPFFLKFGDGTNETQKIERNDGQVFLQILREKKSFTIEFKFLQPNFVAVSSEGSSGDEIIPESAVNEKAKNNFKVFSLPLEWNLKNSDWELSPAVSNFDTTEKEFKNLDDLSVENIGSEGSPVNLKLDSHWQYVKFLYFDRWVRRKLSVPSVLVEAFNNIASSSGKPDIISNWISATESSQCIPWILQQPKKPDNNILLKIRTKELTFIETAGDEKNFTRKLVTQGAAALSIDPGLNVGESVNINFNFANAFRLRFYDLPKLWKSTKYFTQLSGGKGNPAQKVGKFEELASEITEDEKPLIISFDDIILTDKDLQPINWKPDTKLANRIAIFHNSFSKSGPQRDDLSSVGLYKPDGRSFAGGTSPKTFTNNNLGYFTQLPKNEKDRNYISDYPDWTRAIITQGNIFDIFDKRTEAGKGDVTGARAGVRVFDVFSSAGQFVPPGDNRGRVPSFQKSFFCEIQPFFEQEHEVFDHIGRFDIIRLRCSDVDGDRETEIGTCIVYLRLFFNFNKTSDKPPDSEPHNISLNDQKEWIETAIMNLLKRWNGPDPRGGTSPIFFNPGPAEIISADTSKLKFNSKVIWYSQQFLEKKSHFELGIYKHTDPNDQVRAFMRSSNGTGVLGENNNVPGSDGFFTFAHEVGHGGSLVDEYIEQTTPTDFPFPTWLDGFDFNSPGSPFSIDEDSMMRRNREIRARHSWHLAELYRQLDSKNFEYKVKHNSNEFILPHMNDAPIKNFIGFPDKRDKDVERGAHGKYDLFLYPLGQDEFTARVIPSLTKKTVVYDGIFIVMIKMEFDFPTDNRNTIHNFLNNVNSRIYKKFNFKFGIKNKSGLLYQNCLLHFSTRYFADDYSATDPSDDDEHIKIKIKDAGQAEWDSGLFSSKHKLFFPINVPHIFPKFFANMVGLADGTEDSTSSYLPLVNKLLPNVEIFKFIP
jgi:outer membrane protein OmpA-like peptidoglycan-associated protein